MTVLGFEPGLTRQNPMAPPIKPQPLPERERELYVPFLWPFLSAGPNWVQKGMESLLSGQEYNCVPKRCRIMGTDRLLKVFRTYNSWRLSSGRPLVGLGVTREGVYFSQFKNVHNYIMFLNYGATPRGQL